jgi:hypothetical protein
MVINTPVKRKNKKSFFVLLLILLPIISFNQTSPNCTAMIKKGEEAVAAQNLNEAIQHFLGALICDANLAGELGT